MPLQNRVDPFGDIHAVAPRGLFTGNRGVIHDPETRTLLKRRWTTKAWIICACAFRGRRRQVMGRNAPSGGAGWTELFFLDEVTALAAGHRPCFFCRRERATDFAQRFPGGPLRAAQMDAALHRERPAAGAAARILDGGDVPALPDGAMVALDGGAHAVRRGRLLPWSFSGYGRTIGPPAGSVRLVTPPSTLRALSAGYRPAWHPSAGAT